MSESSILLFAAVALMLVSCSGLTAHQPEGIITAPTPPITQDKAERQRLQAAEADAQGSVDNAYPVFSYFVVEDTNQCV
jgi:hypothetical protein